MMAEAHVVLRLEDDLLALHSGDPHDLALADAVVLAEGCRRLGQARRKAATRRGLVDDQQLLVRKKALHFLLIADNLPGLPSSASRRSCSSPLASTKCAMRDVSMFLPLW
jgi:hypothetical protein